MNNVIEWSFVLREYKKYSHNCQENLKQNKIKKLINRLLLSWDKLMPKIHLRQPTSLGKPGKKEYKN